MKPRALDLFCGAGGASMGLHRAGFMTGSERKRHDRDFYRTPPAATCALLDFLCWLPPHTRFWEPAAGDGAILDVLRRRGYSAHGSDIEPQAEGIVRRNFLADDPPHEVGDCAFVITNPPFVLAEAFIRRAARLPCIEGFAFLTKAQFWHAAKRAPLFRAYPPSYVLALTWRLNFLEGLKKANGEPYDAPAMDCIWNVWLTGDGDVHETRYVLLEKPA